MIDFALENRRVVVILDGLDEFSEGQKNAFLNLLKYNAGEFADPVGGDPRKVTTIIAGRQHVIDELLADRCFHPKRFDRLKIQPFSDELQDEYFHGKGNSQKNDPARNPLARRFSHLTWRAVLPENDDTLGELLGLPHTLIQIRQALMNDIEDKSKSELTRYVSQSDLFLHVSDGLLGHAIQKGKVPDEFEIGGKPFDTKLLLAEVLGIVAWRMTLSGYEQAVIPDDRAETTSEIERIKVESETRYLLAHPGKKDEFHKAWSLLETIVWNHRGTTESFEAKSLAFRNRRTQELHVARFLTQHAIQADWDELKHKIGDPRFERILLLAAQMPFKSRHRRLGANNEVYAKTLECIFSRPADKTQRRPTEVMWRAVEFLNIPRQDELDDFRAKLVRTLKDNLSVEFQQIKSGKADWIDDQNGRERAKRVAEGIFKKLDDDPCGKEITEPPRSLLVTLADPQKGRPGEVYDKDMKLMIFKMGSHEDDKDAFSNEKPQKDVWLRTFGIHRFQVRNKEFQLFDPAQSVALNKYGQNFSNPDHPAIEVSWFDAIVFTWFMGTFEDDNGQQWHFALPTEAQWEYSCRAGCTGVYFRAYDQDGTEFNVTKDNLGEYANICKSIGSTERVGQRKPNAWMLYDMCGNVWEWCIDGYLELSPKGVDPIGSYKSSNRVFRGGGWSDAEKNYRSANRIKWLPGFRYEDLGFRLAVVPYVKQYGAVRQAGRSAAGPPDATEPGAERPRAKEPPNRPDA